MTGVNADVSQYLKVKLLARLSTHRALADAPVSEREWLAEHGTLQSFAVGDVVTAKGAQSRSLLVIFEGHLVIRNDRGAGGHKIFEWKTGDVGGVMPYSRGATPPNDVVAEAPTEVMTLAKEAFPELTRECPVVTAKLVHLMLDRARMFTSSDLRDEKLLSLGKLAAGLAHELNNPASAVVRSAKLLLESLNGAEDASRRLASAGLSEPQFAAIDQARAMCDAAAISAPRTPLERADREDELTDWLSDHRATAEFAIPLADTGITPAALDLLAETLQGDALEAALGWISACVMVRTLSLEIESAGTRIHDLVGAVKGFSYMDHALTAEPVDVCRGITDTLRMLAAKTRGKSVHVSMNVPQDLPCARAVGAELNQVWMNLIDNALDAVAPGGHIDVSGAPVRDSVVVRIVDDGPGIPREILGRIWDPFFTTKGVGKGTGLGLDIVKRLLQRHDGEIDVESVPGRTEFQVRLPVQR
ncbi:MAG TPA: ATP-binding protein [Gemmatimonadaceae bacterium]|nr:ATP-binding protein [Gemmatimonadaceae bacterium]